MSTGFTEPPFEPTLQAAHTRLALVDPDAYARTRNALEGAVTRLSPYLTHGLLGLAEVFTAVHARHPLSAGHKFVFELGWRAYWRHVWMYLGDGIHQSLHTGLLADATYSADIPADVLEARTGVAAIDMAVRELYATGYLHNHARMWLASYLVHLRKVYWHVGAQWMLGHLLDGDVASNHLSWQWVAGTGSTKPYLFNADNVAKYAPPPWHCPGTALDTSYEALDAIARSEVSVDATHPCDAAAQGMAAPALRSVPADARWQAPSHGVVQGRNVCLLHPWAMGAEPANPLPDAITIAVGFTECHSLWPWSERRWQFVTDGLCARTAHLWWGNAPQLAEALRGARSVQWQPNPHIDAGMEKLTQLLQAQSASTTLLPQPERCLFAPVDHHCTSFSAWWRKTKISL